MKKETNLSKFSNTQLSVYRIIFIILSTLLIIFGVLVIPISLILGLLCIFFAIIGFSCAKTYKIELITRQSTAKESQTMDLKDIDEFDYSKLEIELPEPSQEQCEPQSVKEHHNVTGTSHYQDNIRELGELNPDYDLTKTEIINDCLYDERIYQYEFNPKSVVLEEEPDNIYDSNAIKVLIDNVLVGYIKKGSCGHIKNLIKEDKIQSIFAEIHGGKYKIVISDYDYDKDKDVYKMDKEETDFYVSIYITLK